MVLDVSAQSVMKVTGEIIGHEVTRQSPTHSSSYTSLPYFIWRGLEEIKLNERQWQKAERWISGSRQSMWGNILNYPGFLKRGTLIALGTLQRYGDNHSTLLTDYSFNPFRCQTECEVIKWWCVNGAVNPFRCQTECEVIKRWCVNGAVNPFRCQTECEVINWWCVNGAAARRWKLRAFVFIRLRRLSSVARAYLASSDSVSLYVHRDRLSGTETTSTSSFTQLAPTFSPM